MSKEQVEEALGRTVIAVHDADSLDESEESPELLAREAARGILSEYDEEPDEVMEMADGFAVSSGSHAIFMGHNGAFDLADLPGEVDLDDDDDEDLEEEDDEEDHEGEDGDDVQPEFTLDGLQAQVEALLSDADPSDEKLMPLLRIFDEAKDAGDNYAAVEAAKAIAEAAGKEFIPRPGVPSMPGKPLDVGPGPGKNTGTGGGGQPKVGVPTPSAPTPKKPVDTGPGPGKSVGEDLDEAQGLVRGKLKMFRKQGFKFAVVYKAMDMPPNGYKTKAEAKEAQKEYPGSRIVDLSKTKESIQFTVPAARIQEFVEIAEKAGAGKDAEVIREGDTYTVTLSEEVGLAVRPFFKGDGVMP